MIEYSAGIVTAYGSAVRAGYTGTYEDFCRQQAEYAENAQAVEQAKQDAQTAKDDAVTAKNNAVSAKDDAISAKNTAVSAKDDAVSAKNTATTKAQEASASATSAGQSATSAGNSATSADQSARSAEQSAQGVSGSLAQIQTNKEDIEQLKADLADKVALDGENQVSVQNAVFLNTIAANLCDGVPHDNLALTGDSVNGYTLGANNARYNLLYAKIKPNTQYTIIAKLTSASAIGMFRIGTATTFLESGRLDGSICWETTNKVKPIYTFTTGESDNYIYIYGVNNTSDSRAYFIQLSEGALTDFTTDKYNMFIGEPNERFLLGYKDKYTPKVKIVPEASYQFTVYMLDESSGDYIGHRFNHLHYDDTISYGNEQSKTMVTQDVWYASYVIAPNGEFILQGNTNFIHAIGNMTGHEGHVGAGHGCCVAIVERFLADGKEFNPSELSSTIYCNTFTFIEVVKHYLNDRQKSISMYPSSYSGHAIPTLDNDGNPIITGIEYLAGEWVGNAVNIRNRFDVKLDGVKFLQCHAGMLAGFYPYFTDFTINGVPYIWNHTHSDDYVRTTPNTSDAGCTFVNTDVCGSDVIISPGTSNVYTGNEVILLGGKYYARKRMVQNIPTRQDKSNIMMWVPPSGDGRIKAYFMPCICTSHAVGAVAEEFNNGDVLDTDINLVIGVSQQVN